MTFNVTGNLCLLTLLFVVGSQAGTVSEIEVELR